MLSGGPRRQIPAQGLGGAGVRGSAAPRLGTLVLSATRLALRQAGVARVRSAWPQRPSLVVVSCEGHGAK